MKPFSKYQQKVNFFSFKAVNPARALEVPLSDYLSERHPGKTADVIAVHPTEPWMIMKEITGTLLRQKRDKQVWQRALQEYAALQTEEAKNVEEHINLGVPDRRIPVLRKQIEDHLEEMYGTGLGEEDCVRTFGCCGIQGNNGNPHCQQYCGFDWNAYADWAKQTS